MYMNRLNWVERVMEAAHIPIGQLCTRLTKTSPRPRDSSHLPFRPVRVYCDADASAERLQREDCVGRHAVPGAQLPAGTRGLRMNVGSKTRKSRPTEMPVTQMNAEQKRLIDSAKGTPWKKWGPYLSERQWGTVREDYSKDGDAWKFFPHEHARSRAYRSGEDGLAGFSDEKARLCFALALWNGQDPFLKERLFGLASTEGNHGEDVKEYYFYLDGTPTHSYLKWLYKYPQQAYPYDDLIVGNRRSKLEPEYELIDTGVFDDDRYFDVYVEYAKSAPEDVLIKITICNRGAEDATLHVLPTLWFRNTWTVGAGDAKTGASSNDQKKREADHRCNPRRPGGAVVVRGGRCPLALHGQRDQQQPDLWNGQPLSLCQRRHQRLCDLRPRVRGQSRRHRHQSGGASYFSCQGWRERGVRLRLMEAAGNTSIDPFAGYDRIFEQRVKEADEFYRAIIPPKATEDEGRVMRQALAGMLWSKQYFLFELDKWIKDHGGDPFSNEDGPTRNREWGHMINDDIISMPDKWEFPWYASWDLAFHTLALSIVDIDFAKAQLDLMLGQMYLHPNGQMPAYEWNFSDVNPPVHAWATLAVYRAEEAATGERRPRVSQTLFPQTSGQFHLVAQPQGPVREKSF